MNMNLKVGKHYRMRKVNRVSGEVVDCVVRVNWIEECEDKWYIGVTPRYTYDRPFTFATVSIKKVGEYKAINCYFEEVA